jgi:hypothetical protein
MSVIEPETFRLAADHAWRTAPGHKILVLAGGAVRLDYPESWVVDASDDWVKLHNRAPPEDECALGVSFHRWPLAGAALTVATLVREALECDERAFFRLDPLVEESRPDIALAWGEGRFIDPRVGREACARLCLARGAEIQALLTFDFWLSDLARCQAQWIAFLASLRLGQWVADPRRGPSPPELNPPL